MDSFLRTLDLACVRKQVIVVAVMTKQVVIETDGETRRALKVLAASEGVSMKAKLAALVAAASKKRGRK